MKPAKTKSDVIALDSASGMLKARKSVSKGKGKGAVGSSCSPVIPPPAMPPRSLWAFNLFMQDFRKTDDLKSIIMKAGHEKWHSMTESERGSYEERLEERSREFEKCYQIFKNLNENVDEAETREHQDG